MLRLAVVVVLALIAASAATASPNPPVISEKFTLLPCPANPTTTLDLQGCAQRRILKSNAAINRRVKVIFFLLKSDAARGRFARSERLWLTYRRAACASRSDVYEGGSLAVVVFANCTADLNAAHLKELVAFEHDLRTP